MSSTIKRVLLVVGALALATMIAWDIVTRPGGSVPRVLLVWSLTGAGAASLRWRRRWPVQVAVFTLLCAAAFFPLAYRDTPLLLLIYAFALFTVALEGHLTAAVTLGAVTMLGITVVEIGPSGERHVDDTSLFLLTGWLVGVIAVGHAMRSRQAYLREVEERARAAERERAAAEREKEVRARQSATEERLRIARELHDVLGHNISLINVQATAALHRHARGLGANPTTAAAPAPGGGAAPDAAEGMVPTMETVRSTSKEALRELRSTLGLLRQVEEEAPTAPAEVGLPQLSELAARARVAGVEVRTELAVPEEAQPLSSRVEKAAYRIVQEALTNVVRHAGATSATVTVRYERTGGHPTSATGPHVRVMIEDDGQGVPPDEELDGSGLEGMAERARALGGALTSGNARDGSGSVRGFRVEATLPAGDGT
ncbi:sensor histidine kinase [Streptomyces oceani]|uniref:histidine kinase n=1 Tax=Streptomyces oceani TaxID=1075402 RepID=A0A1E7JF47_9ACTN|nr:sensor histidine kinase [Streptomyces oceani]OEU85091.1 hypothetical protein AN216_26285 [Streptomyces oceani]